MSTVPYPTPEQVFQMQYESVRRDEVVGVLLAFFLGCFGIHHFYLKRVGLGILYCCFCWTGIPAIIAVIECFFMPGRVRAYNAAQAAGLAASLGVALPGYLASAGWPAPGYGAGYGAGYAAVYAQPQTTQFSIQSEPYSTQTVLIGCSHCHQTNPSGARFCSHCGQGLT